jgi:hypothetical protein
MRFGRTILAGLAPLIGMSALMTGLGPEVFKGHCAQLIQSVIHLVSPPAEASAASASPQRPSPQAVLEFAALAETPLGHSLWMVAAAVAPHHVLRRLVPLRC